MTYCKNPEIFFNRMIRSFHTKIYVSILTILYSWVTKKYFFSYNCVLTIRKNEEWIKCSSIYGSLPSLQNNYHNFRIFMGKHCSIIWIQGYEVGRGWRRIKMRAGGIYCIKFDCYFDKHVLEDYSRNVEHSIKQGLYIITIWSVSWLLTLTPKHNIRNPKSASALFKWYNIQDTMEFLIFR